MISLVQKELNGILNLKNYFKKLKQISFSKVACIVKPKYLLKSDLHRKCFHVNFVKFFRTAVL